MKQPKECLSITTELLLAKSLLDWRNNPNMSLRRIFRNNFKSSVLASENIDSKDLLDIAITSTMFNLLRQTFVTNYEYLRRNIDDKMTEKLKDLRNSASAKPNNLNTAKFLDAIRQSFAHNDIRADIPNWKLNDNLNIEINFKGSCFTFDFFQLHSLMNEFLSLKKQHFYFNFDVQERDLYAAVEKRNLSPKSIKQYIIPYKDVKTKDKLDENQCNALFNLLTNDPSISPVVRLNKIACDKYFILQKLFPCKHNAGHISYINNICFRSMLQLRNNYISREDYLSACEEFEHNIELFDEASSGESRTNLIYFMQNDIVGLENTLIANALFTIFTITSIRNLESCFVGLDVDINRLRNSVIHGRYFYNYNLGFEFYDGRQNDKLEHIATLSTTEIYRVVGRFLETNFVSGISPT